MYFKKIPVLKVESVNDEYFVLRIRDKELTQNIKPGQFFQIKDPDVAIPLLPRPFGVYDIKEDVLSFLIKKVGESTKNLSILEEGHIIQLLGPLGNGFPVAQNKKVLIASGGIGYAPMPYLEQKLKEAGNEVWFYHGGQSSNDVFCDDVQNCTEDGSCGHAGLVTEHIENCFDSMDVDVVYACGPELMLQALSVLCNERNIPIYVSLERIMACGVGACCGCVIKIKENGKVVYKKVCKDGPVFGGAKVIWDE